MTTPTPIVELELAVERLKDLEETFRKLLLKVHAPGLIPVLQNVVDASEASAMILEAELEELQFAIDFGSVNDPVDAELRAIGRTRKAVEL